MSVAVGARSAAGVIGVVGAAALRERLPDGSIVAVFKVADEQAICSYLLGLGEDVEVLSPPALRGESSRSSSRACDAGSTLARR